MTLQALTLAQPWPQMFLLDENPKRLENRDWTPPRKLIGQRLALHGGRLPKSEKDFQDCRAALNWVNDAVWAGEEDPTDWLDDEDIKRLCVQGVFAVARLTRVVTASPDPWRGSQRYGWVLDPNDFIVLPKPIPCPGQKNLWDLEGELLTKVLEAAGLVDELGAPPTKTPRRNVQDTISSPAKTLSTPLAQTRPPTSSPSPLLIPGLFCPGIPITQLPPDNRTKGVYGLEQGRLYGLPVGNDWVTVERNGDTYTWCSRRTTGAGEGSRTQLEAWLAELRAGRAA